MTDAREIIARAVAVARGDTPEGEHWAQLSPKSRDYAELGVRRVIAAGFRILGPGELDAEAVERCIKELNKLPWFEDVVSLVDVEDALRALEDGGRHD